MNLGTTNSSELQLPRKHRCQDVLSPKYISSFQRNRDNLIGISVIFCDGSKSYCHDIVTANISSLLKIRLLSFTTNIFQYSGSLNRMQQTPPGSLSWCVLISSNFTTTFLSPLTLPTKRARWIQDRNSNNILRLSSESTLIGNPPNIFASLSLTNSILTAYKMAKCPAKNFIFQLLLQVGSGYMHSPGQWDVSMMFAHTDGLLGICWTCSFPLLSSFLPWLWTRWSEFL